MAVTESQDELAQAYQKQQQPAAESQDDLAKAYKAQQKSSGEESQEDLAKAYEQQGKASHGVSGSWEPEGRFEKATRLAGEAWDVANRPLLGPGRAEKEARAYVNAPMTLSESEHPLWHAAKVGTAGAYADAAEMGRNIVTSPLGLATLGYGALEEKLPSVIRTVGRAVPAAFGAEGAVDAAKGGMDIYEHGATPENVHKTLGGASRAFLGGAGTLQDTEVGNMPAKEAVTAPVRAGAKAANRIIEKAPESVLAPLGAALGEKIAGPTGAAAGTALGYGVGKAIPMPKWLRVPGENFGLPRLADEDLNLGNPTADLQAYRPGTPQPYRESVTNVKRPGDIAPERVGAEPLSERPVVPTGQTEGPGFRMGPTRALPEAPINIEEPGLRQEVLPPEREPLAETAAPAARPMTLEAERIAPKSGLAEKLADTSKGAMDRITQLTEQGLGGKPLEPNVPLRDQATAPRTEPEHLGVHARANGKWVNDLEPTDREVLHNLSNVEVRKLITEITGEDPGVIGRDKGKLGTPRPDAFDKMIKAGIKPADIMKAVYEGKHFPGTVSGGSPDTKATGYSQKADLRYPAAVASAPDLIRQAEAAGPSWTIDKAGDVMEKLNQANPRKATFDVKGSVAKTGTSANDLDVFVRSGKISDASAALKDLGFKRSHSTPHGEVWTRGDQAIDFWVEGPNWKPKPGN